jgi:hypothetical protein
MAMTLPPDVVQIQITVPKDLSDLQYTLTSSDAPQVVVSPSGDINFQDFIKPVQIKFTVNDLSGLSYTFPSKVGNALQVREVQYGPLVGWKKTRQFFKASLSADYKTLTIVYANCHDIDGVSKSVEEYAAVLEGQSLGKKGGDPQIWNGSKPPDTDRIQGNVGRKCSKGDTNP